MHWIDCAITVVPFAIVMVVSWNSRRYVKCVADFMTASRCAGRYLVCNASGEAAFGAVSAVAVFEYIHKTGFAMTWWTQMSIPVSLLITLTGFVIYRYRETRVMTMAQFFEIRYSKGFRILAGILAWVSGIINYGIFPAVGARFFVNYCGLPQYILVWGATVPTFAVLMAVFISLALFLTLVGGQLTIMISDCLEGLLSGILYISIAVLITRS
jgi:SSS family solute:Na+ symporter